MEDKGSPLPWSYDPETMRQLRHDVRTPLNAVMGIATLLDSWQGLNEKQRRMVEVLQSSSADLHRRLDALFAYLGHLDETVQDNKPAAAAAPAMPASPAPASPKRVLLAEDYQPNALVARSFLEDMGYEVDIAQDGREAIDRFRAREYSAVLLDVQMPEIDGLEAAKCMRTLEKDGHRPRTPILALTAHATRDDALFCLRAGMDDYLSKPFDAAQLSQKLQGLVARA